MAPRPALLSAFILQVIVSIQTSRTPSLYRGAQSICPRLSFSVTYPPSERSELLAIGVYVAIIFIFFTMHQSFPGSFETSEQMILATVESQLWLPLYSWDSGLHVTCPCMQST